MSAAYPLKREPNGNLTFFQGKQQTKDKTMKKYKLYLIRYLVNKEPKLFSYEKLKDYEINKLEWMYNHI